MPGGQKSKRPPFLTASHHPAFTGSFVQCWKSSFRICLNTLSDLFFARLWGSVKFFFISLKGKGRYHRCDGSHENEARVPYCRLHQLRRYRLRGQEIRYRCCLCHVDHHDGHVVSHVGQEQGRGLCSHPCPAHCHSRAEKG